MQVLGPDLYNGTQAQLASFRDYVHATFPMLLLGGSGTGNENLYTPYVQFDNYAVISKQGILRYLASYRWPHGNRYHLDEIRGCIDSLVTTPALDVTPGLGSRGFALSAAPNPFRRTTSIELTSASSAAVEAQVTVHDLAGRRVASLWNGPVAAGVTRVTWDGRSGSGEQLAPGVYLVQARVGNIRLDRRLVIVR